MAMFLFGFPFCVGSVINVQWISCVLVDYGAKYGQTQKKKDFLVRKKSLRLGGAYIKIYLKF